MPSARTGSLRKNNAIRAKRRADVRTLSALPLSLMDIAHVLGISFGDVKNDMTWMRKQGIAISHSLRPVYCERVKLWRHASLKKLAKDYMPFATQIARTLDSTLQLDALEARAQAIIPEMLPKVAMGRTPRTPPASPRATNRHWRLLNLALNGGLPNFADIEELDIRAELIVLGSSPNNPEELIRDVAHQFLRKATAVAVADAQLTEEVVTRIDAVIVALPQVKRIVLEEYLESDGEVGVLTATAEQRSCSRANIHRLFWDALWQIRTSLPQYQDAPIPRATMVRGGHTQSRRTSP